MRKSENEKVGPEEIFFLFLYDRGRCGSPLSKTHYFAPLSLYFGRQQHRKSNIENNDFE